MAEATPESVVVSTRVVLGKARRQDPKEVVGARDGRVVEQGPGTLSVAEQGDLDGVGMLFMVLIRAAVVAMSVIGALSSVQSAIRVMIWMAQGNLMRIVM